MTNKPSSSQTRATDIARGLTLLVCACALVACGSMDTSRMVPDTSLGPNRQIPLGVRVAEVSGGKQGSFGTAQMIANADILAAVVATLNKSGIFAGVSTTQGDIDLHVSVLSQDQKDLSIMHYTARMLVVYKFVAKDGSTIWSETYDSSFSSTAFAGGTRTVQAREGAVRENLAALIQGIRERWPSK